MPVAAIPVSKRSCNREIEIQEEYRNWLSSGGREQFFKWHSVGSSWASWGESASSRQVRNWRGHSDIFRLLFNISSYAPLRINIDTRRHSKVKLRWSLTKRQRRALRWLREGISSSFILHRTGWELITIFFGWINDYHRQHCVTRAELLLLRRA